MGGRGSNGPFALKASKEKLLSFFFFSFVRSTVSPGLFAI